MTIPDIPISERFEPTHRHGPFRCTVQHIATVDGRPIVWNGKQVGDHGEGEAAVTRPSGWCDPDLDVDVYDDRRDDDRADSRHDTAIELAAEREDG